MVHTFNFSTWEAETGDRSEFEASLSTEFRTVTVRSHYTVISCQSNRTEPPPPAAATEGAEDKPQYRVPAQHTGWLDPTAVSRSGGCLDGTRRIVSP